MSRHSVSRTSIMPQDFARVRDKSNSKIFSRRMVNGTADARFLVVAILCAVLVTSSLVFLVWTKMAQMQAGYRVHALQSELLNLKQERSSLRVEVASLKRHDRLHVLAKTKLNLHAPKAQEVMRITLNKEALLTVNGGQP